MRKCIQFREHPKVVGLVTMRVKCCCRRKSDDRASDLMSAIAHDQQCLESDGTTTLLDMIDVPAVGQRRGDDQRKVE
jgi:hypothetical protein